MRALVFDVGGTHVRGGLWRAQDSSLEHRVVRPSPGVDRTGTRDPVVELVELLGSIGDELVEGREPANVVGVAFPGPVDADGRVTNAPTLWGATRGEPIDLASLVSRRHGGLPARVANDLTAAGYRHRGPDSDFCIVTVSSGIGNKVFLAGEPVVGPRGLGGEMGHWRVDDSPDAPLCECGARGHLGAIASGRATAHHVRALAGELEAEHRASPIDAAAEEIDNVMVAAAFRDGDAFARAVVGRGAAALGKALALVHAAIGVERFVVMGGFARALGPDYLDRLALEAADGSWATHEQWRDWIEAAPPDDDSGLIGMGRLLERRFVEGCA